MDANERAAPPGRDARPDHDLVVEVLKVFARLDRAMNALRQFHHAEATRLAPAVVVPGATGTYRPSPAQIQLAIELSERGPGTISELAARSRVSASAISLLVDRMVTHGMVERVRSTDDRRVVQVRLSTNAAEMASAMLRVARTLIKRFVEDTPPDDRETFALHFDRFARTLDTALPVVGETIAAARPSRAPEDPLPPSVESEATPVIPGTTPPLRGDRPMGTRTLAT